MRRLELSRVAWEGLLRNKMRSLLTMLGVIIGVAAVIMMVSISAGTEATIEEQITGLGTNLIFVTQNFQRGMPGMGANESGGLVYEDAYAIADHVNGVQAVVVEQASAETVKAGSVTLDQTELLGSTADFPSVRDMQIAEGRYFKQEEVDRKAKVAVLGSTIASELFAGNDPIGEVITVGNSKLTVIGVVAERGLVGETDYDARVYTPITVVFQKFTPSQFARIMGDRVRVIYVELEPEAAMDDVILQIQLLLAKRHDVTLESADFSVTTQQDIIDTQESTTAAFRNLLGWVASVSLVVGGIGIMNIMLVSVTERTREIGIRQSVGATPADVRWQFLAEALLLSFFGGLLGILAGIGGALIFGAASGMRTVVLPTSIMLAFLSAAAVGVFFGYYPANKAALLDPIEALRHE
jgi:putative ABC transport system permease protein